MPSGVSLTDPWAQSFFGHRPRKALQDWISFGHLRRSTQFESTTGTFHQRRAATRSGSVPFHWPMKLQAGLWCFLLQSSRTKSTKISQQMSTGSRDRLSSESHEFTFSVRSHFVCFWRWIADSFTALSRLSAIFAKHPAGVPPKADVLRAETVYLQYRDAYNSSLVWMELLCVQCTCMSSIGLASWALQERKLLYQVRPKMHALEHMRLNSPNGSTL